MGIFGNFGRITVNGKTYEPGAVINGGRQLVCGCGNTSRWGDITMADSATTAECRDCGQTVHMPAGD